MDASCPVFTLHNLHSVILQRAQLTPPLASPPLGSLFFPSWTVRHSLLLSLPRCRLPRHCSLVRPRPLSSYNKHSPHWASHRLRTAGGSSGSGCDDRSSCLCHAHLAHASADTNQRRRASSCSCSCYVSAAAPSPCVEWKAHVQHAPANPHAAHILKA